MFMMSVVNKGIGVRKGMRIVKGVEMWRRPSMRMLVMLVALVLVSINVGYVNAQYPFTYQVYGTCPNTQRYDIASYSCEPCGTNQLTASNSFEICQCTRGYYSVAPVPVTALTPTSLYAFTCTSCLATNQASKRDGTGCIACGASTTGLSTTVGDCTCPSNAYMLVEHDAAGQPLAQKGCLACPTGMRAISNSEYACLACPSSVMTLDATGKCVCPASTVMDGTGQSCLTQNEVNAIYSIAPADVASIISYRDIRSRDDGDSYTKAINPSFVFSIYYASAATQCRYHQNRTSCEILANLCALQFFDLSSSVCALFNLISSQISTTSYNFQGIQTGTSSQTSYGWKQSMPFLYFGSNTFLDNENLRLQVNLKSYDPNYVNTNRLQYLLSKFTLNGTLVGTVEMTDELQLCGSLPSFAMDYAQIGVNYENQCNLDLSALISSSPNTYFYELFIQDSFNNMFPVPVKVLNLRYNGALVNVNGNDPSGSENFHESSMILTHRFFLVDTIAGKTSVSALPNIITYAKRITLRVTLQDGDYSHIYPPLLVIEYASREYSSIISSSSSSSSEVSFNQEYVHDTSVLWQVGLAFFIISLVFGFISAIRRMADFFKKSYGENIEVNFTLLLRFIVYLFDSISNYFFCLLVILSFAVFLFYKGQQQIYFLLPPANSSENRVFFQIMVSTFVGKIAYVIWKIYQQIQLDVLLIDWEKPKDLSSTSNFQDTAKGEGSISHVQCEQATVWRKIFILHKWHELQSYRILNVGFILVFFIFMMKGLSIENLAFSQPTFTISDSSVALNPILYFALTAFFFGILYICHRLFLNYVWNRYYTNPLLQFIDLLYLCNISMFCCDERFHAYYIHGKSVHRNADVTIHELHRMMHMENKMWTKERGLQNGVDTFEWYLSREFRTRYDREFLLIIQRYFSLQSNQITARRSATQANQSNLHPMSASQLPLTANLDMGDGSNIAEKVLSANASFNAFMCAFIEKSTSNYSYDCVEPTYWSTWFGLPAQLPYNSNKDILFYDRQLSFRNTLPTSIEVDWLQMLITCFGLCYGVFQNALVSILVCYCVDRILMGIHNYWARINMCKKTCIEEKFLR